MRRNAARTTYIRDVLNTCSSCARERAEGVTLSRLWEVPCTSHIPSMTFHGPAHFAWREASQPHPRACISATSLASRRSRLHLGDLACISAACSLSAQASLSAAERPRALPQRLGRRRTFALEVRRLAVSLSKARGGIRLAGRAHGTIFARAPRGRVRRALRCGCSARSARAC